jgi:hypothetical protein
MVAKLLIFAQQLDPARFWTDRSMMELRRAMMLAAGIAAGCAQKPADATNMARPQKDRVTMENGGNETGGVRNLPSSFGRSFASLDEYLEHLRRYAGPVDQPWYREIRPGEYELVTTMTPAQPRRNYTRAQLMREFGFTH